MSPRPLLAALALSLLSTAALADTGVIESINDDGLSGTVFDDVFGSLAFSDADFGDLAAVVGDAVSYTLQSNKVGTVATDLALTEAVTTIDAATSGSLTVSSGERVVLSSSVTKDVSVEGGTLVLQVGADIGRDLELSSGRIVVYEAAVGRDLTVTGGDLTVLDDATLLMGRDLNQDGGALDSDSGALVHAERDLVFSGDASFSMTAGSEFSSGRDIRVDITADLDVSGSLDATRDLSLTTDGSFSMTGNVSAAWWTGGGFGTDCVTDEDAELDCDEQGLLRPGDKVGIREKSKS